MAQILSKGEYAKYRGVTPGAVSQWIAAGKISGPALVGAGRQARIDVAAADRQLSGSLDMGQQLARGGQPDPTRLAQPASDLFTTPPRVFPTLPNGGPGEQEEGEVGPDATDRYKAAKAGREELAFRRDIEKDLADRGTYTLTVEARADFSRTLSQALQTVEQWLPDVAGTIASRTVEREAEAKAAGLVAVPMTARDLTALLKTEFRALRIRMAEQSAARALTVPSLITVPLPEDGGALPVE